MNPSRLYVPVVLGALAAGGVAFFAAGRPWANAVVTSAGLPPDTVAVTGTDAEPLVSALAIVVITAALAVLASSARVRRAVGIFTVVVAIAAAVAVLTGGASLDDGLRQAVRESPAFTGAPLPAALYTVWRSVTAVAFLLAAVLGAVTAWFGPAWPTMGSRYDAPMSHPSETAPVSDGDIWKALDEGRDPTQ